MVIKSIESYFNSNIHKPFFAVIGDTDYKIIKDSLRTHEETIDFIRLSDCCSSVDKKPNLDVLRERLREIDVDCKSNKVVLLGLGEYLALEGNEKISQVLNEFISFNLGAAQAVFLLRGVNEQVKSMMNADPRIKDRQAYIATNILSELSFNFSSLELGMYDLTGFKNVLREIENGESTMISANTGVVFEDSRFPITRFNNPYDALCKKERNLDIPQELGNDSDWESLLKDITEKGSIERVFTDYFVDDNLFEFYNNISGNEYKNWLYYIFLYRNRETLKNKYLQFVIMDSKNLDDFRNKVLNAIINVAHTARDYETLYSERKHLLFQYPESELAMFISNNRYDVNESIYKLTDNTLVEREEIIANISQRGLPENLDMIYPDLALYLKKYYFQNDSLNDLLTDYFDEYKKQKLFNSINDDFLSTVEKIAVTRDYNRLRTRDELVSGIEKDGSYLCWIDALGVEYLSYIVELANKKGLAVSVKVGRSELPSITSINKSFYDNWPNEHKRKTDELDEIKHHEKGGYKYGPSNLYPIHLAKELQVISKVIDEAATDLGLRKYDRYVIASDHGASRLAVLRKKEEKYDTGTQGEHSGRCCKAFEGCDLPFTTEENGYIVLADYGRFKGSRAANVEVHGGASLEEVVVPVIVLSLRDNSIVIKIVENVVKADYKTGISFTLFVNKRITKDITVSCKGKKYNAEFIDENHYRVSMPEIKKAGIVVADVFLDDNLVSQIEINVAGKSGSVNSDFDDLF